MKEQTNSITKFVKIIAKEEIFKVLEQYQIIKKEECPKIARNGGECWNRAEDDLLRAEFTTVIKQIANRHGRSPGAITSRLYQKGIVTHY